MAEKQPATATDACRNLLRAIEVDDEKSAIESAIGLVAGTLETLERIAVALEGIEAKLNGR